MRGSFGFVQYHGFASSNPGQEYQIRYTVERFRIRLSRMCSLLPEERNDSNFSERRSTGKENLQARLQKL